MRNIFKWFLCQKYLTLKNRREKIIYVKHKQIQTLWENDIICGIQIIPIRNRKKITLGREDEGREMENRFERGSEKWHTFEKGINRVCIGENEGNFV